MPFLILLLALFAFSGPGAAQPRAEMELAKDLLRGMQAKSIRESREYCGMIGVDAKGRYVVRAGLKMLRWGRNECVKAL